MVVFPKDAFEAAVSGLDIWWNIVFPALLPFFVISQVLIGLGVVHMMGIFLEPVMRPLFNVPGTGSFVMAMGLASGFPIGAILTAELRSRSLCSRVEAERLVSFTNTADPLFMFGAVAVGMLHYPRAGLIITASHYLSSIALGLIMRFYRRNEASSGEPFPCRGRIVQRACTALLQAREKDGRPLGQLMGDAIRESVNTLLLIGGFIILFSVIIRILGVMGAIGVLSDYLTVYVEALGLNPDLTPALLSGFFEIDLGCQYTALLTQVPITEKIIACGVIIAWSGLSVHAQVASINTGTDIRIFPFIIARVIHAILAGTCSALLLGPGQRWLGNFTIPVILNTVPRGTFSFWWARTAFMLQQLAIFSTALLALA
ncbi:MAG TPA: sporulation integral membrane protein YlbJ, partial [Firmicutes bacterium]|nr:sporulation integral membrane protein YlbJ [Bacillota bacterium]